MDHSEEKKALAVAIIACIPIAVKIGSSVFMGIQAQRKKEKALKEAELRACSQVVGETMNELRIDPTVDKDMYAERWNEEITFLNIVSNY